VRPGRPNGAASGFMSGIIREPLAGQRAVCPVDASAVVALASPDRAIAALLCAATATNEAWGGPAPLNMPSLSLTVGDMVAALERAKPGASALIDWVPDPVVVGLVAAWPPRFQTDRAEQLGLSADPDFDSIIALHQAQTG
jgi:D-erythronate 2-dehydrogenase